MVDESRAAPSRAPVTGGAAALVALSVAAVASFTVPREGTRYHAYFDDAHVVTICEGHTAGVKITDTATPAQCSAFYRSDMTAHMTAALVTAPNLAQHPGPLKAAGDFSFNAGDRAFAHSPMAAKFAVDDWQGGCDAFPGYYAGVHVKLPVKGATCQPAPGGYFCQLPGLVSRREGERAMCLAS